MKILGTGHSGFVEQEVIIGRFFQPLVGQKIALMMAVFFGLVLVFLNLGMYLYFHLPPDFPPSLFVFLLVFLCGLSTALALYAIDKAKIGHWFIVTQKGISRGRMYLPWEKLKAVSYLRIETGGRRLSYISRSLTSGIYFFTTAPWQIREQLTEKNISPRSLYELSKEIAKNCLVVPLNVENLPQLMGFVFDFAPHITYDMDCYLLSQIREGDSLLVNVVDLFQARIYGRESNISSLHNFYTGINHLLKLELSPAERHLRKAYEEEEFRARPYLALAFFLQGKYKECISLLEGAYPSLNKGEWLILLTSLTKLGRWDELEQKLREYNDNYSELFRLGVLCARSEYYELISRGEKLLRKKYDPSLDLCLKCARQLYAKTQQLPSGKARAEGKRNWRYYLYYLLSIIGYFVFSILHGWTKGLGVLIMFFGWIFEGLMRGYLQREAYFQFLLLIKKAITAPFWCSLAFLSEIRKEIPK